MLRRYLVYYVTLLGRWLDPKPNVTALNNVVYTIGNVMTLPVALAMMLLANNFSAFCRPCFAAPRR